MLQTHSIERSFMSLLAILTECQSTAAPAIHIKLLWLKQLRMISSEGGIVLRTFHIRVTYVNVMQVSRVHGNYGRAHMQQWSDQPYLFELTLTPSCGRFLVVVVVAQTLIFTASIVALASR